MPGVVEVLLVSWIVRALCILLLPAAAYSSDVTHWQIVAADLRAHVNPYAHTTYLNWPPLWLVAISGIDHAARALSLSFILVLRLSLITVESVLVVVLYSFLATRVAREARQIVLWGICLNPIAILLICEHGNFDVVVGLCCLTASLAIVDSIETQNVVSWLIGATALGVGALAKTVPLILGPLLAGGPKSKPTGARALAAVLLVGPFLGGLGVIYVLAPHGVTRNVIHYRSSDCCYGIPGLARTLGLPGVAGAYSHAVAVFLIALWLMLGFVWLRKQPLEIARVLLLSACVLLALTTIGSGYGAQYAYWWLPLLVATYPLFDKSWRRWLLGFYVVAATTYVVEYALFGASGAFLLGLFPGSDTVQDLSASLSTPTAATLVRLPLFLASVCVLVAALRRLSLRDIADHDYLSTGTT